MIASLNEVQVNNRDCIITISISSLLTLLHAQSYIKQPVKIYIFIFNTSIERVTCIFNISRYLYVCVCAMSVDLCTEFSFAKPFGTNDFSQIIAIKIKNDKKKG